MFFCFAFTVVGRSIGATDNITEGKISQWLTSANDRAYGRMRRGSTSGTQNSGTQKSDEDPEEGNLIIVI